MLTVELILYTASLIDSNTSYSIRSSHACLSYCDNQISLKGLPFISSEKHSVFTFVMMHFPDNARGYLAKEGGEFSRRRKLNPAVCILH